MRDNMTFLLAVLGALIGSIAIALGGCSSHGKVSGSTTGGTMSVQAADAPFPVTVTCLNELTFVVDQIEMLPTTPASGAQFTNVPLIVSGTSSVTSTALAFDVLELRGDATEQLALTSMPEGSYSQIRIHLTQAIMSFHDGTLPVSFPVPIASQLGLVIALDPPISVARGSTAHLLLDFDLGQNFTSLGGASPTCADLELGVLAVAFNPVVRAIDLDRTGAIVGEVDLSNGAGAANVEVMAVPVGNVPGAGAVAAETFSVDEASPNGAIGTFVLHVPPGSYDIFVQAQDAGEPTLAQASVNVTAGAQTTVVLTAP